MLQTLKSEYERQVKILERKATFARDRLSEIRTEIENLENNVRKKEAQLSVASKHEINNRNTFFINGNPICPICLATKNIHDKLTPDNGTDEYEKYECKSCGYTLKVQI